MNKRRLQEKELESVAGGFEWYPDTIWKCTNCGYKTYWDRPYPAGFLMDIYGGKRCYGYSYYKVYKCPGCGRIFDANDNTFDPDD